MRLYDLTNTIKMCESIEQAKGYIEGELNMFRTLYAELVSAAYMDSVRCRECLRWDRERAKNSHIQFKGYCTMFNGFCDGDKYCAWGERKDNE